MTTKQKSFEMDDLKTQTATKAAKPIAAQKPTRHGAAILSILEKLKKFDWDEKAMQRAR